MATAIPLDFTAIFIAMIVLVLFMLMLARFLSNVGQMTGNVGYSATKWFLLIILGLFMFWGLYNQIGNYSGYWGPLTFDQWFGPIVQKFYQIFAAIVNWLKNLVGGLLK